MPMRNVNLTERFDPFIETGVTSGLAWLRAAAKEVFGASG